MAVPNIFGSATSAIPLSQLDTNFATPVTIGNTAVQLGNTVTSFGNVTLTNVTISSGNVTITGANVSGTANVSTLIITGNQTSLGNVSITGNVSANIATFGAGSNTAPAITTTGDTNTGIFFPAADTIAFSEGGTESMRIDSSGNVGIGMTPAASYGLLQVGSAVTSALGVSGLQAYVAGTNSALGQNGNMSIVTTNAQGVDIGGSIGLGGKFVAAGTSVLFAQIAGRKENSTDNNSAGYLQFATQPNGGTPTERMRIDSSGNLLVGDTAANGRIYAKSATANSSSSAFYGTNSSATLLFQVRSDGAFNTGTAAISPYNNTTGSAANLFQGSDGFLGRSTSSIKYKTDVHNATHGLAEVMQLRPVLYKGINDGEKVFGGFIAEEIDALGLTEFVQYADDGSPDALAYGNMVSLCVKAIQEQQALIQSLTARITALENK